MKNNGANTRWLFPKGVAKVVVRSKAEKVDRKEVRAGGGGRQSQSVD